MTQDNIFSVAALGLEKNEMHFIRIMLGLTSHVSTNRADGRYEWTDDPNFAHIVIVDAEDETSLGKWHEISGNNPSAKLLLVYPAKQLSNSKYFINRPFGPAKVLMVLDQIIKEVVSEKNEADIFSRTHSSKKHIAGQVAHGMVPVRYRALVVDDSPTVRKQLVLELGNFNIRVDTAESGELGLELLGENHYDMIFLDIMLPGIDGYQVCKNIRRNQKAKLIPIVMLTGKSSPFDRVRGKLSGCNAYLTKPVNIEDFYRVLESQMIFTQKIIDTDKKIA